MVKTSLHNQVLSYLHSHNVMTVATYGPEGLWSAAVFYVNDGFTLYFLSAATSRHCRNIADQPQAAITIQEDYKNWPEIKGIQAEATIRPCLEEAEQARALKLYGQKFPVIGKIEHAPVKIVKALQKITWYRADLQRLFFIDNSKGFGHRDELTELLPTPTITDSKSI